VIVSSWLDFLRNIIKGGGVSGILVAKDFNSDSLMFDLLKNSEIKVKKWGRNEEFIVQKPVTVIFTVYRRVYLDGIP
jgi:hypothetical protein